MNYLAHMVVGHWAGLDEKGVLGNFIGDAVKGPVSYTHLTLPTKRIV